MEAADTSLDAWEESLGLPAFRSPKVTNEASRLLDLSADDRRRMSPDECGDAVLVLAIYGMYILRAGQREESREAVARKATNDALREIWPTIKAYGYEERRLCAIAASPEAKHFESIRAQAEARKLRLLYLSQRIEAVSKAYGNLANGRRRQGQLG